jgi:hypothetical protein
MVLDKTGQALIDWISGVEGAPEPTLGLPAASPAGRGLGVHLLELAEEPAARASNGVTPLQFAARYLITAWDADDPLAAHRLLGELAFAAMECTEYTPELQPLRPELWQALGVPPQAALVLRVPVRRERGQPPPKRVRRPLGVQTAPLRELAGRVLAPGALPIPDARVELLGGPEGRPLATALTDRRGSFRLSATLAGGAPQLRVSAKGFSTTVPLAELPEDDLTIAFDPFEAEEG